jgi:hypothetical protein
MIGHEKELLEVLQIHLFRPVDDLLSRGRLFLSSHAALHAGRE